VSAHDGFTLADSVSYAERHNEANGENNNDGHGGNHSANWGVEGPTDDPSILEKRARVHRLMLATLFVSQGTPMVLGGDAFGRTQQGNNNAYCQDNEISWFDWEKAAAPEGKALTAFAEKLAALRHRHPVLRSSSFLHGNVELAPGILDIAWFDASGEEVSEGSWNNPEEQCLILRRAERGDDGAVHILSSFFNSTSEDRPFRIPPPVLPTRLLVDSAAPEAPERVIIGDQLIVKGHSVVLILSTDSGGTP